MKKARLIGILLSVFLMACGKLPMHTGSDTADGQNSSAVLEIQAMQKKAFAAEDDVIAYVKADNHRWTQHEFGWWYRYTHKSGEHIEYSLVPPAKDTCCVIHETVYTLDDNLLWDAVREVDSIALSNDNAEPLAYQTMLREIVPTDTVLMLIPWPFGYGYNGRGVIPPCTNLLVQMTILSTPYTDIEFFQDTISIH